MFCVVNFSNNYVWAQRMIFFIISKKAIYIQRHTYTYIHTQNHSPIFRDNQKYVLHDTVHQECTLTGTHAHIHTPIVAGNQKNFGGNEVERRRSRVETEERWSKTKAWQKEIRETQSHDAGVWRRFRSIEGGVEASRLSNGKYQQLGELQVEVEEK